MGQQFENACNHREGKKKQTELQQLEVIILKLMSQQFHHSNVQEGA